MKKFISVVFIMIIVSTFFGCEILDHEHIFSKEWTYDKEYHWHESECGHDVTSGKTEHIFTDGRCDFCDHYIDNEVGDNESNDNRYDDINLSLVFSRYEVHSAPIIDNKLPIMNSFTDYTYNYYFIDAGYINNVPIVSSPSISHDGKSSKQLTFSCTDITTKTIETSMQETATQSISATVIDTVSVSVGLDVGVSFGLNGMMNIDTGYSRQWGTSEERQNSITSVYTVADEVSKQTESSVTYMIGIGEKTGYYRISVIRTCDVYYFVKTNRENTELIECWIAFCVRDGEMFSLEYSENDKFEKTDSSMALDLPDDSYKHFDVPTETISNTITLNESDGYDLNQKNYKVVFGMNYELPVPQRYNYAFVGWFSEPEGKGLRYADYNGNSLTKWNDFTDKTLYAYWILISEQKKIKSIQLGDQECYSKGTDPFSIDLDIKTLREIGYKYLQISISGSCSDYDYKMNERTRYLIFSDALKGDLLTWKFIVKGFSGVEEQKISIDNLNSNGSYQLQLVSDQSDAYNEKLKINNIVITIRAVK